MDENAQPVFVPEKEHRLVVYDLVKMIRENPCKNSGFEHIFVQRVGGRAVGAEGGGKEQSVICESHGC